MGLGAGLMYFFDPGSGRRRRALVADQFTHARRSLEGFVGEATRDLRNRTRGLTAKLGHRIRGEAPPSDEVLLERVRATLGHFVSHPRAIEVAAMAGHVVLRGPIRASELKGLLPAIAAVRGVLDVADELEAHHGGENHPSLQGGRPRAGARPTPWQVKWSPATKLLMSAAGSALALRLARRGPMTNLALGTLGLLLATRGSDDRRRRANRPAGRLPARSAATGAPEPRDESGLTDGGRGRTDDVGRTDGDPGSGPFPPGDAEVRTPFARGQFDDQGREVEGGSERSNPEGTLPGGATPTSGSPSKDQAAPRNP
jgi:hypothetical protein